MSKDKLSKKMLEELTELGFIDVSGGTCDVDDIINEVANYAHRNPEYLILEARKKENGDYFMRLYIDKESWLK